MFVLECKERVGLGGVVSLLRGYSYRFQGVAGIEGIVRYRHQGGGQDHPHQLIVIYDEYKRNERRLPNHIHTNKYTSNACTIRPGCLL